MDMNLVAPDRVEIAFTLAIIILEIFGPLLVVAGAVWMFNRLFGNTPYGNEATACGEAGMSLKPCPCGVVPDSLRIHNDGQAKWAYVSGNCCDEWHIEFRTKYYDLNAPQCMDLAIEAWNDTPRGERRDG